MPAPDLIRGGNRFSVRKCDHPKRARAHSVSIETECALARLSCCSQRRFDETPPPAHFSLDNVTKISYNSCTIDKCVQYPDLRPAPGTAVIPAERPALRPGSESRNPVITESRCCARPFRPHSADY